MTEFRYSGVRSKQTDEGHWLVQFSALASEIAQWVGVPQKTRFLFDDDIAGESVGFQRGEDEVRVKRLGKFLEDPRNIVQNPLLCSLREQLNFIKWDRSQQHQANVEVGELVIEIPDFEHFSVVQCLHGVLEYLEKRVPELGELEPPQDLVARLKVRLNEETNDLDPESNYEVDQDKDDDYDSSDSDDNEATRVFYEDSHIMEFWKEIAARHVIANEINPQFADGKFLGFSKDALLSYLRPVVLVDGQHRLLGALAAASTKLNGSGCQSEIETRIAKGESPEEVENEILQRESRLLPVSLLMTDDAEEQVFQFVVVNQRATPVGRALLGTIISTTLSTAELERVASRLKNAAIPLEESRAVSFMAMREESPFFGKVDRGLPGGQHDGLPWNVLASLITIFRDLSGGRVFGIPRDWAAAWQRKFLDDSPIVSEYLSKGFEQPFEYWCEFDGPWRQVFLVFWHKIREKFGSTDEAESHNYWGHPRTSNLYNKVSLTILAADFFQYLVETRVVIQSEDQVANLVDDWLANVVPGYFNRDWQLRGIKKDVVGIRNQWADLWVDYRKVGGRLPRIGSYRVSRNT